MLYACPAGSEFYSLIKYDNSQFSCFLFWKNIHRFRAICNCPRVESVFPRWRFQTAEMPPRRA